jgi:hypothetical protein
VFRMNRAVLAALFCSATAPAAMCDLAPQMSQIPAAQWMTLEDTSATMPRAVAAPTSSTLGAPPTPEATVSQLDLPEGEAWSVVKTTVGENVAVLRPPWLPARFRTERVTIEYAYTSFARYRVGYTTGDGLILFAAGAVNSSAPSESLAMEMGEVTVTYSETSGWPERQVTWIQNGVLYSIQARGVTRDELISIARALCAPELPSTSTEPEL